MCYMYMTSRGFVFVPCLSWFCYAIFCVLFRFSIILVGKRERESTLIVFLMSCGCYCHVALSHGAMCQYALCDCGIS